MHEIERSKEEVRNSENLLLITETEIFKLLNDLKYKKDGIFNNIIVSKSKLERLGLSLHKLIELKAQFGHLNLCLYESKPNY